MKTPRHDPVNNPEHYMQHPSGVECIEITEHFDFCRGNAIKYIWRSGFKGDSLLFEIEDLKKAKWYLERKIAQLEKMTLPDGTESLRVSGVPYSVDQEALRRMRTSEKDEL